MPGPAKPSLTIKRHFLAPPSLVFAAWTEPRHMMAWWATKDAVTLFAESDLRIGGRYRVVFRTPDGESHDVSGVYREVEPPEKLIMSWAWATTPERESQVTLLFRPDGAGTSLTLKHEFFFDEEARDNHNRGWTEALDNLERFAAGHAGSKRS
ncbi:MAG TPA: SRPBCC domain-containing protein [Parvularculaceae bacterium]|nr:SRPBCC domain-containing protein [Amphiplicatus sp.]MCB9955330.1 SRPBCC domain-containing protein [Caulobacterales bacterium]HPE30548.1 SRPBCC domain-containing protein [Parvularculaceae bacterium]HRX39489.1 SRPBCC domain-containing protein [Parvularculaceae bacterium]